MMPYPRILFSGYSVFLRARHQPLIALAETGFGSGSLLVRRSNEPMPSDKAHGGCSEPRQTTRVSLARESTNLLVSLIWSVFSQGRKR